MASRIRYSEEFRKKVVEESKKGELSHEELADKYCLPRVLLEHWIEIDNHKFPFFRLDEKTHKKEPFFNRVKNYLRKRSLWLKRYLWQIVGCLSILFVGFVFVSLCSDIVESEKQDLQQPLLPKMDSLIQAENAVNEKLESLEMMDSTLNEINYLLKEQIAPLKTIRTKRPICNCQNNIVK